jgi:hypothetical protein
VDHELDRTSKGTALFVDVLLAEQVTLTNVPALYGVPSRDRDRGAESDRLLGHARPRCSNSEHADKDNQQTVPSVSHLGAPFGRMVLTRVQHLSKVWPSANAAVHLRRTERPQGARPAVR